MLVPSRVTLPTRLFSKRVANADDIISYVLAATENSALIDDGNEIDCVYSVLSIRWLTQRL